MTKKIVITVNNAWYGYNFRLNLAKSLKQQGYEVCFVAPYDGIYTKILREKFTVYDLYIDAKGINPITDIKTILELHKIYKRIKPDVILNFTIKPNIYSSLVAGALGISIISNITGLGTIFIRESLITKIAKQMYKKALKYNNKVFFQNNDDRELFLKYSLVNIEKTSLLPGSGVDLTKFVPRQKNGTSDKFVFLLISRLLKDKGIIELIEAIKILKNKYKNIEVHFLGAVDVQNKTAISKKELDSWVKQDLIKYLGTTDNVQDMIANANCVVLPSYREGTPRSLLEACAMKKPIIATDVVGCKEVVEDGINGFLCEVKNVQNLVHKMEMMVNLSEEERVVMGEAGRKKIIKEFDEKIVINKYFQSIKEILHS